MENAKRIGCMWALAAALGIGLAVANTPAVALAAPGDDGKGSTSSESSNKPSAKGASAATNDAPKPRRHPPKQADETAATSTSSAGQADTHPTPKKFDTDVTDVRKRGGSPSVAKTTLKPAVVKPTTATRAPSVPTAPAPAELTMLGLARRESTVATSAADPDFISSTHGFFGLFSVTSAADPDDNNYVAFVLRTPFFTNVLTSGTDPEDNLGFGAASIGVAGQTVNTFMSPFLNFSIAIPIEDPFAELFTALVRAGF
jgi:hypothetical protein